MTLLMFIFEVMYSFLRRVVLVLELVGVVFVCGLTLPVAEKMCCHSLRYHPSAKHLFIHTHTHGTMGFCVRSHHICVCCHHICEYDR
jgi:hypothetical protein